MVLTAEQHHSNIRIFVSAHKQATFPKGKSILPVQVGAAHATTRFPNTLHDDEGENISAETRGIADNARFFAHFRIPGLT